MKTAEEIHKMFLRKHQIDISDEDYDIMKQSGCYDVSLEAIEYASQLTTLQQSRTEVGEDEITQDIIEKAFTKYISIKEDGSICGFENYTKHILSILKTNLPLKQVEDYTINQMADCWRASQDAMLKNNGGKTMTQPFKEFINSLPKSESKEAVEFAEWKVKNYWEFECIAENGILFENSKTRKQLYLPELFELFKQSQTKNKEG